MDKVNGVFLYSKDLNSEFMVKCLLMLVNDFPEIKRITSIESDESHFGFRVHFPSPEENVVLSKKHLKVSGKKVPIVPLRTFLTIHGAPLNCDEKFISELSKAVQEKFGKLLSPFSRVPNYENKNTINFRACVDVPEIDELEVFKHEGYPDMLVCLPSYNGMLLRVTFYCRRCGDSGHVQQNCPSAEIDCNSRKVSNFSSCGYSNSSHSFTSNSENTDDENPVNEIFKPTANHSPSVKALCSSHNTCDDENPVNEIFKPTAHLSPSVKASCSSHNTCDDENPVNEIFKSTAHLSPSGKASYSSYNTCVDEKFNEIFNAVLKQTAHLSPSVNASCSSHNTCDDENPVNEIFKPTANHSPSVKASCSSHNTSDDVQPFNEIFKPFACVSPSVKASCSSHNKCVPSQGNLSAQPKTTAKVDDTKILSRGLKKYIREACAHWCLNRRVFEKFLHDVKWKRNPREIARKYTDPGEMKLLLQEIISEYDHNQPPSAKTADWKFICWLTDIVERF